MRHLEKSVSNVSQEEEQALIECDAFLNARSSLKQVLLENLQNLKHVISTIQC